MKGEKVIRSLAGRIGLTMGSPSLFFLYRTAVTAYLGYLYSKERVINYMEDNKFYWLRK